MTIPRVAVGWVPTILSTRKAPGSKLSTGFGYPNEDLSLFPLVKYSNAETVPCNTPTKRDT
jgi:hypothetical protein